MKITSVELHPANSSDICVLSFRDPSRQNPYNVKSITGLDADEIIPRYYGGSGSSDKFYMMSLQSRPIILKAGLQPRPSLSESYSSLRDDLYKLISSSRRGLIDVKFKNGINVVAVISGFVSKLETNHFDKAPEVQISLTCEDPWLKAPTPTIVSVTGLDPADTTITDSLSTAPHGFMFEIEFLAALDAFTMTDPTDPTWSFSVEPVGGFEIGDILHISSEYNDKHLYLVRGASTIHIADTILQGSVWPLIFPGENNFALDDPTGLSWEAITYYPTYWGV